MERITETHVAVARSSSGEGAEVCYLRLPCWLVAELYVLK